MSPPNVVLFGPRTPDKIALEKWAWKLCSVISKSAPDCRMLLKVGTVVCIVGLVIKA